MEIVLAESPKYSKSMTTTDCRCLPATPRPPKQKGSCVIMCGSIPPPVGCSGPRRGLTAGPSLASLGASPGSSGGASGAPNAPRKRHTVPASTTVFRCSATVCGLCDTELDPCVRYVSLFEGSSSHDALTFVEDLLASGCATRDPAARRRPNSVAQCRRRVCTRVDAIPMCAQASERRVSACWDPGHPRR